MVEAVKLFLTGDDGSSGGTRFESSSKGSEVERGKCGLRRVRDIYSRGEKPLIQGKWMNVPMTLLILATCVTHVLRSGDRVGAWVNGIIISWDVERFERQKLKVQIRIF